MSDQLPDPLVPTEVDLRDFGFMPLDVRRLLTSETWIEAGDKPKVGHAVMCLWCEAWHQVPAASLPDNDKVLARLAMCDARTWNRIRVEVLSGWVKCSDGLLYHPVVAEKARESWAAKVKQRERTKAATEAREAKRRAEQTARDAQRDVERNEQRNVERDVHQGTGTVKGQGQGIDKHSAAGAAAKPSDPVKDEIWKTGKAILIAQGESRDTAGAFLGKLCKDFGQLLALDAVRDCAKTTPAEAKAWLIARCQDRRALAGNKSAALERRNHEAVDQAMKEVSHG